MNKAKIAGIVFTILALISVLFLVSNADFLSISESQDSEELEFCSSKQECLDYLDNQGMPEDYLSEEGITIECYGGVCYANK